MEIAHLPRRSELNRPNAQLSLGIYCETEAQGLGMGVLMDGTPFLSQRSLAVICGVENAHIGSISAQWNDPLPKPRISKIRDILASRGESFSEPHIAVRRGSRAYYAYVEAMSLAIIEYYAFDAGAQCQEEAKINYRRLSGRGFKAFVYDRTGYEPKRQVDDPWRPFHDRLSLVYNRAPAGYFSVFRETAEIIICMGEHGIPANESIIVDISVGKLWSAFWIESDLEARFGKRREYNHDYPPYFPQAVSNPQTPWCYPEAALGEFRRWLREHYVAGGKLRAFVVRQIDRKQISTEVANRTLAAYGQPTVLLGNVAMSETM